MINTEQQLTAHTLLECCDAELVRRVQQGEVNAFEGIMRRYNQRLFRIARSIVNNDAVAMDVMQEAYIKAFAQLKTLQDSRALVSWLSRIARNEALQYLRQNQRTVAMEAGKLETVVELTTMRNMGADPGTELANKQLGRLLESQIDALPDAYRSVFVLRAIEQCSVREAAEILDIKLATVKTRYYRANALLQRQLREHMESAGLGLYEFAGHRCDAVVKGVLARLCALLK